MRGLNRVLFGVIAGLVLPATSNAVAIGWNFGDDNGAHDTGTPVNFTVGTFGIGNSVGAVADPINTTSASTTYAGASGTGNIGNAFPIGALNPATSGFLTITFTPDPGFAIQVTEADFGNRNTGTGPQQVAVRSSVDAFAADIVTAASANDSTWRFIDNSAFSVIGPVGQPVEVRVYGFGGTGSPASGTINGRFDDIAINVTAVPEPASLGLAAVAGVVLLGRRRRSA